MKNVILTAALVSLIFSGAMNYGFISGKLAKASVPQTDEGYSQQDVDALGKLASLSQERGRK
jgi:hypothetical protein